MTKILDMVPDFVNRFTSKKDETAEAEQTVKETDADAKKAAASEMEQILKESVKEEEA